MTKGAKRALVIECKFSDNPTVVGRDGYHQTSTYLAEASGRLCDKVVSMVVAPTPMLAGLHLMTWSAARLASHLQSRLPD